MKLVSPKTTVTISFCLYALLLQIGSASAHRVNVFAWVEGDTVYVESKFSGGKKVTAGKIVVLDTQGVELLADVTNDEGEYSFKVPKLSDLRIMVVAGQGHQGEWTVRKTELQGSVPETNLKTDVSSKIISDQMSVVENTSADDRAAALRNNIKPDEIEAIIEAVLDRKLKPITRMLADNRQKSPTVRDIFGGIGYILGLVGIAAYVNSRKKKE